MTIEKVFAIEAPQVAIWDALWADLSHGEPDAFTVAESQWPRTFSIELDLAGLPSRLTYTIEPRDGHCEVTAALEPLSLRYRLLQILTFGRMRLNYELVLVQGLSSLKEALEGPAGASTSLAGEEMETELLP